MRWNNVMIGVIAALVLVTVAGVAAADDNVADVSHSPSGTITSSDTVTVTIEFDETINVTGNEDNLTDVKIIVCEIDGPCDLPADMVEDSTGVYTFEIRAFDGGLEVGYKFEVSYTNMTESVSHNGSSAEGYFTYQVEADEEPEDDDDDGGLPFPGAPFIAVALVAALLIVKRRR